MKNLFHLTHNINLTKLANRCNVYLKQCTHTEEFYTSMYRLDIKYKKEERSDAFLPLPSL